MADIILRMSSQRHNFRTINSRKEYIKYTEILFYDNEKGETSE